MAYKAVPGSRPEYPGSPAVEKMPRPEPMPLKPGKPAKPAKPKAE